MIRIIIASEFVFDVYDISALPLDIVDTGSVSGFTPSCNGAEVGGLIIKYKESLPLVFVVFIGCIVDWIDIVVVL